MDNQDRPSYSGEEHFYHPQPRTPGDRISVRRPFWRRHLAVIIAIIAVILMIIFASTTVMLLMRPNSPLATIKPTSTSSVSTPNATSVPSSTPTSGSVATGLPCTVDLNNWRNGSADWKTLNGMLLNDGTNGNGPSDPTIVAPCQLGNTANYAVETQIQVISHSGFTCFGITARGSSAGRYMAGIGDCGAYNVFNTAYLAGPGYSNDSNGSHASFDPSTSMHTYRVEVSGNVIKFLIDGSLIVSITDNRYLTGTQIGLWSTRVQLQVTSFRVTALS
jgi:Glycosyl hydrolases family 16